MTLRFASWSSLVLLGVGLSCSSSDDSPSHPPPPVEEAGSGGTGGIGGTGPSELGGSGGSGARGGSGNQGNQGGDGGGESCEPVQCALTCDIADGVPEKGEPCTERGNHCEDSVLDASGCECKTTDYYCCDQRWSTTPCGGSHGAAGSDAGGAAGAP